MANLELYSGEEGSESEMDEDAAESHESKENIGYSPNRNDIQENNKVIDFRPGVTLPLDGGSMAATQGGCTHNKENSSGDESVNSFEELSVP